MNHRGKEAASAVLVTVLVWGCSFDTAGPPFGAGDLAGLLPDSITRKDRAKIPRDKATKVPDSASSSDGPPLKRTAAFPGAEGFGVWSRGGRGGKVLFVNNLKDFLPGTEAIIPGSLRGAVLAKGPRTIIFRVSGTITLKGPLEITEPYLTLAGQSAPGDGVCLKGHGTRLLNTHDVVIRHLRFRPGDLVGLEEAKVGKKWETDALSIHNSNKVIIDHCSASWGNDEVLSITSSSLITVQWTLITESLNDSTHTGGKHGHGGLVNAMDDGLVTQHRNLWAYHTTRCPRPGSTALCKGPGLLYDFRYNVIHMGGKGATVKDSDKVRMNFIGNSITGTYEFTGTTAARIYQAQNRYAGKDPGWTLFKGAYVKEGAPFVVAPVSASIPEKAQNAVLASAGAILPKRDLVDQRVVAAVQANGGKIINSQDEVGGWPTLSSAPAPTDSDLDGMPDSWEGKHGLNTKLATDNILDPDGDGYTNIEEWLNKTDPKVKD